MTLNEMVSYIADQVNLTNPEAKARIARTVNVRYKRVTSSIGLIPTRREEASKAATIGDRYITFTNIEKLDVVFRKVGTKNVVLDEITDDEMLKESLVDEPATKYSIFSVAPSSVTLRLNCVPVTEFVLYAHGLADASTLSGNDSPAFPESFHDILIHGALADEYRRKEHKESAKESEMDFERRLSDLRMFIAKSAYLKIYNSKNAESEGWWDTGPR